MSEGMLSACVAMILGFILFSSGFFGFVCGTMNRIYPNGSIEQLVTTDKMDKALDLNQNESKTIADTLSYKLMNIKNNTEELGALYNHLGLERVYTTINVKVIKKKKGKKDKCVLFD